MWGPCPLRFLPVPFPSIVHTPEFGCNKEMDSLDVVASFNKNKRITLERVEKFIGKDYFADVSLFGKIYPVRQPLTGLLRWDATGAPRHIDKPDNGTNTPAQSDDSHDDMPSWLVEVPTRDSFSHYKIGEPFGPTWSTHWYGRWFSLLFFTCIDRGIRVVHILQ